MRKIATLLLAAAFFASCGNNAENTKDPVDSMEQRKDSLIDKVDSSINAKIDSLEERKDELKNKFDSTIDKRIDSAKKQN